MYQIHLKFAKEFISELKLNEKQPEKYLDFFFTLIGLKAVEAFLLKFHTSALLSFDKREYSPERLQLSQN